LASSVESARERAAAADRFKASALELLTSRSATISDMVTSALWTAPWGLKSLMRRRARLVCLAERMEADVDLSNATDQELRDELDAAKKDLGALVNAPLVGREGSKIAEMDLMIASIESELDKRNADRT
jgi:hypothetical protein